MKNVTLFHYAKSQTVLINLSLNEIGIFNNFCICVNICLCALITFVFVYMFVFNVNELVNCCNVLYILRNHQ